jgi:hypothetical protein
MSIPQGYSSATTISTPGRRFLNTGRELMAEVSDPNCLIVTTCFKDQI